MILQLKKDIFLTYILRCKDSIKFLSQKLIKLCLLSTFYFKTISNLKKSYQNSTKNSSAALVQRPQSNFTNSTNHALYSKSTTPGTCVALDCHVP